MAAGLRVDAMSSIMQYLPAGNNMRAEAEEPQLLEAVNRK
jgi:hypothetical protein